MSARTRRGLGVAAGLMALVGAHEASTPAAYAEKAADTRIERADDAPTTEPSPNRPPVIVVSLDTLRADHVGAYGYDRDTTPNLDSFAKDAVLFERAFTSGGGTLPAHMTLLTGLPPGVHGVTARSDAVLPKGRVTLAEALGDAGYRTAGFTGAGYVRRQWGFHQGFDRFDDEGRGFEQILPKALRWLDRPDPRPPFLFLHTLDIHSDWDQLPYDAPAPYRDRWVADDYSGSFDGCRDGLCASKLLAEMNQRARRGEIDLASYFTPEEVDYMRDLYDGGIAYTDARFGELMAALRERGLYDDALIVVVSDHGEEFLEHGLMLHEQIYDEIVRIPLLVKLPNDAHAGERVDALTAMMDVMPTVLEVVGTAKPAGVVGASLLPIVEGQSPGRSFVYLWGIPEKLRTREWSLLRGEGAAPELYDLLRDPGEKTNVAATRPAVVHALSRQLDAIKLSQTPPEPKPKPKADLSPEVVDQLEALGYLRE